MAKRALDQGLYLMTHWNVCMVCPPLTITRDELDEGGPEECIRRLKNEGSWDHSAARAKRDHFVGWEELRARFEADS